MVKRVVVRAAGAARGYVDGRFIGEEKDGEGRSRKRRGAGSAVADSVLGAAGIAGPGARKKGRGKTPGQGQGRGKGQGQARGAGQGKAAQGQGNRRGQSQGAGQGAGQGQRRAKGQGGGQGRGRGPGQPGIDARAPAEGNFIAGDVGNAAGGAAAGNARRGRGGRSGRGGGSSVGSTPGLGTPFGAAPFEGGFGGNTAGAPRGKPRKNRTGKKTPFRAPVADSLRQQTHSPTQAADIRRSGDESKSGQFAEALAASANVKRERLHKVMAQSGIGSRRDMEIMIGSGRVMVNGIVATAGTQVAPGDNVLVDHRPIKLKFTQDLPRVLLYHKPEGEIVTTNDPGNRITVFDNLPRVENGKWIAVGRLDINTSGLLIFTTGGELANRFMHPRYEVEREYAVRILGELTEEQTQNLLSGVDIGDGKAADEEDDDDLGGNLDNDEFDHAKFEDEAPFVPPIDEHDDEFEAAKDEDAQPVEETDEPIVNHPLPHAAPKPHELRNGLARFDVIEKRGGEGVNHWYHVVIREGRNREVRKMFESQGLTVSRLIRTRFGKIELPPRLLRGKLMELTPDQVRSVLVSAGMVVDGPTGKLPTHEDRSARARGPREPREPRGEGRERGNARGGQRTPRVEGATDGLPVDANRPPREPRDGRARRGKGRGPGRSFDATVGGDVANAGQMAGEVREGNAGTNVVAEGDPARNKRRRSRGPRRDSRPPRESGVPANVGFETGGEGSAPAEGAAPNPGPREPGQERRTNPRGRRNFRGRNRRGGGRNGGEGGGGEGGAQGGNGGPSGGGEPNGNV